MNAAIPALATAVFLCLISAAQAEDDTACREATRRGLAQATQAAVNWQRNKTCFSCHHQTLPMLAMTEAARAGIPLDHAWLQSQADTTHRYFEQRIDHMNAGEHVPGGATTASYGLWALSLANSDRDATTTSIVTYLMKIQGVARLLTPAAPGSPLIDNGRWTTSCRRPPMQGSDMGDTILTLIGMEKYAADSQREPLAKARAAAEKWLAQARIVTQEDRIWRLWGAHHLQGGAPAIEAARKSIASAQRPDGGWSAGSGLESDAFSTGETLFVLRQTGSSASEPLAKRAMAYLISTQLLDGSWLVKSRVKFKAQPYFENGDPHGEHQFLSTAGTAWAVAGLAQMLAPPSL